MLRILVTIKRQMFEAALPRNAAMPKAASMLDHTLSIMGGNISVDETISSQTTITISGGHVEANTFRTNADSSSGNNGIIIEGGILATA